MTMFLSKVIIKGGVGICGMSVFALIFVGIAVFWKIFGRYAVFDGIGGGGKWPKKRREGGKLDFNWRYGGEFPKT